MIDAGETLDPALEAMVDGLRKQPVTDWDRGTVDALLRNPTIGKEAVPRKLAFGSDFVYAHDRADWPIERGDCRAAPCLARGGLTPVWGGAMLPVHDRDIGDWPIGRADLAPHYERVLAALPLAAESDRLEREFPLYRQSPSALAAPRSIESLRRDLDRVAPSFAQGEFVHGRARLAVRLKNDASGDGCVYCGLCLAGCPLGSIYRADAELTALERGGAVKYLGGMLVQSLREDADGVELSLCRRGDGAAHAMRFDRVFLGAGAINSTAIMLRSLDLFDRPVRLKDSRKFALPMVRWRGHAVEWPHVNSLAGLFIEVRWPRHSPHWVHLQVSAPNDYVLRRLGLPLAGPPGFRIDPRVAAVRHMLVAWCSLHSSLSDEIELRVNPEGVGGRPSIGLAVCTNEGARHTARRTSWALARLGLRFGTLFLAPFRLTSPAGSTGHLGGSFPMRRSGSDALHSDVIGRPMGLKRIHLVDAATFPSIPATTIALTIMANAERIASSAPLD
ncbi:MAG TPA: hypothetical protein VMA53_21210 [Stellaceae bacterium]|nr:hypothetical protein [Stellaceae bacterium]